MSKTSNDKRFLKTQILRIEKVKKMLDSYRIEKDSVKKAQAKASINGIVSTMLKTIPEARRRLLNMESRDIDISEFRSVFGVNPADMKLEVKK